MKAACPKVDDTAFSVEGGHNTGVIAPVFGRYNDGEEEIHEHDSCCKAHRSGYSESPSFQSTLLCPQRRYKGPRRVEILSSHPMVSWESALYSLLPNQGLGAIIVPGQAWDGLGDRGETWLPVGFDESALSTEEAVMIKVIDVHHIPGPLKVSQLEAFKGCIVRAGRAQKR